MFEEIRKTLAKQLRVKEEKITLTTRIKEDLGADSLDVLELLTEIEDKMGITIPDEELMNFNVVGDIVKYLEAHRK